MATRYRLRAEIPGEMNGYPLGDGLVQLQYDGGAFIIKEDLLEPVQPPSIDDPVDVPLELIDAEAAIGYEPDRRLSIISRRQPHLPRTVAEITAHGRPVGMKDMKALSVDLTAQDCRDAARALWKLANEAEATDAR